MNLPSMGTGLVSREVLRIAGGYGAPAAGNSPAGGLDIDQAGHMATDGDVTIGGEVSVGSDLTIVGDVLSVNADKIKLDATRYVTEASISSDQPAMSLRTEYSAGASRIDFDPVDTGSAETNDASVRMMRNTNTSGIRTVDIYKGNGSSLKTFSINADTGEIEIGDFKPTEAYGGACSDETTDLEVGVATITFRIPYVFTVTGVRASVTTAPTGGPITVDVNESGTSILSTKLTIDAGEKTSKTAATPAVISDSALVDDAEITVDIDVIGSTIAGAGLKVWLIGSRT